MSPLRAAPAAGIPRTRLWILAGATLAWALYVVVALDDLQILRSAEMRALARRQHEQLIEVDARRGAIFDREGRALAVSTDAWSIYASTDEIEDREAAARSLATAAQIPLDQVRARLGSDGFVRLRRRIAPDVADRVRALRIPGVHLIAESKRFYPHGDLAAHVLGFVVPDEPSLREGLERRYDAEIRGTPGAFVAQRDAAGRPIVMTARQQAIAGDDLVTSIDEVIQHTAERELEAAIEETGAKAGSVVVLHTPTGEVLAIANYPSFNPNRYSLSDPPARRNRAVTDVYEPGSTFKLITAAAAVEEGLVRPSEVIDGQHGLVRVAGIPIRDHKPFGLLTFAEAIAESSNICLLKVGMRLDARTFHDHIARFGFGRKTGVDLPGESRGLLRPAAKWAATSEAYLSFGQEIGVTALQLASAFSAIANRGVMVAPRVVTRIIGSEGDRIREPQRPAPVRVIRESTADVLIDLMEGVVTEGTGKKAAIDGYRVAGKTGTAQKIVDGLYSQERFIASFAGFVPSRRPVLTILIVLDEPRGVFYHGGDVAAPVFRRIAAPVLDYLDVPRERSEEGDVELADLGAGREPPKASASPGAVAPASITRRSKNGKARQDRDDRKPQIVPLAPRPLDNSEPPEPPQEPAQERTPPEEVYGPVGAMVPDVAGAPLRDAVVALAKAGFKVVVRGEGFVAEQIPAGGEAAPPGSAVVLRLGRLVIEDPPPQKDGTRKDGPAAEVMGASAASKSARPGPAPRAR